MTHDPMDERALDAWVAQHVWVWSQEDNGDWRDQPFAHEADARAFEARCARLNVPTSRVNPHA
jgi:hypothetical protein